MLTDPLADMLTRIRNAGQAGHHATRCPASKLKHAVARVLQQEGYLDEVALEEQEEGRPVLRLVLRYGPDGRTVIDGLRRVSRPSRRVYVGAAEIPRVRNGLGVAVLSTPRGVLSDRAAREQSVGGELVCEVW
jgi:small subunit ribosomal protein S8